MATQSKSKRAKSKQAGPKRPSSTQARRRVRPREPSWVHLSDEELLQKRFCDLRLTLRHGAPGTSMPGCQRSRSLALSGAERIANAFSTPTPVMTHTV